MADIELVIKIPEEKLGIIKNKMYCGIYDPDLYKAIENGTPLPKGHGRLKDVDKIRIVRSPDSMIDSNVEIALQAVKQYINQLPTIIEADSGSNANIAGVEE